MIVQRTLPLAFGDKTEQFELREKIKLFFMQNYENKG